MSFGKDSGQVARIGGYGASTAQQMAGASRRQMGARRGPPSWANNYKPSLSTPDTIRILEGAYAADRIDDTSGHTFQETFPWLEVTEHYSASKKKSMICSAGVHRSNKKLAKPCRGCDVYWEEHNERKRLSEKAGQKVVNPNSMSMSSKYVFNVLIYGYFYKCPQLDRNGRIRTNSKGDPYTVWKKYEGSHQDAEYHSSKEHADGIVQSWAVGHGHFITLTSYAEIIQRSCLNCGGQNCVYTQQWVCPACNAPTLDQSSTSLSPDQIQEVVSQRHTCRSCQAKEYPRAVQGCQSCNNPRSARLYDVDMQVQRVRQSNTQYQLLIPHVYPPKSVDPKFADAISKASDLSTKFSVTPMEEQVKDFGHPAPEQGPDPSTEHPAAPTPQGYPPQHAYAYPQTTPQQYYDPNQAPQYPTQQAPQQAYYAPPQQQTHGQPPGHYQPPAATPTQPGTQPPGQGGYGGNYGGQQ